MANSSMSRRGDSPCTKRTDQEEAPFLRIAELILPWLTPQELASLSSTCTSLIRLGKSITAVRSADAARSLEPVPIPFINTVDAHPYAYFLYSPTQLLPSSSLRRQFWASPPNAIPNPQFGWNQFGLVSDAGGCDCGEKCVGDGDGDDRTLDCPCSVLTCGEVITECGPNCGCGSDCGNRATQKGVAVQVEIVRVVNKGWGLFAAQFIQSGQFVCEYTGRTSENVSEHLTKYTKRLEYSGPFLGYLIRCNPIDPLSGILVLDRNSPGIRTGMGHDPIRHGDRSQTPAAEPRAIRKGRNANLLNKRDGVRLYVFFSSMSLWLRDGIIETSEGMVSAHA
ncbi:hypothetical protein Cgig2_025028 [Carnegiea gigantea]|uniref:Histone-lysine N-methyltransferase SETMAR n=1 Tax=Carnegiea gigantea TaxID=171969 RepID=A0A9Q1K0W9_9CARY|nr:hypothetical protein Cgig2_025028 [Carnegiea gigantea]